MSDSPRIAWRTLRSETEFRDAYDRARRTYTPAEKGAVLAEAASMTDPKVRDACVDYVLADGPSMTEHDRLGNTALHCLLGAVQHDLVTESKLVGRMLEMGADLNAKNARAQTPMDLILSQRPQTDAKLEPLYDVVFAWAAQQSKAGEARTVEGGSYRPGTRPDFEARQQALRSLQGERS